MLPLSNSLAIARIDLASPLDERPAARTGAADVEVSMRLYRDGSQITVVRRTVEEGSETRTVGIDAVVR